MKTMNIILLSVILLFSCNQSKTNSANLTTKNVDVKTEVEKSIITDTIFTFNNYEFGKIPSGWTQYFTGKGDATDWKILDENDNSILAQLSEDNPNYHFNEIVFDGIEIRNVELKVRMKGVDGEMDQGGGFVWRFIDADNYYVVRANPLEDNVVLYKVENGKRTDLPVLGKGRTYGVEVEQLGSDWNDLKLTVIDNLFTVYLNNKQIFQVKDETFTNAGKVGLWTKADAVTYFDDFQVTSIESVRL